LASLSFSPLTCTSLAVGFHALNTLSSIVSPSTSLGVSSSVYYLLPKSSKLFWTFLNSSSALPSSSSSASVRSLCSVNAFLKSSTCFLSSVLLEALSLKASMLAYLNFSLCSDLNLSLSSTTACYELMTKS
jgi:hypothetical protein